MLPSRTTKTIECISGYVIASLHRHLFDRVGHVLDSNPEKSICHFNWCSYVTSSDSNFVGKCQEGFLNSCYIKWLILRRAKHGWKKFGLQFTQHHIAIRYGQRTATPVTSWTWISTGGFWSHSISGTIKKTYGTTSSSDCMYHHHRRSHANTCYKGLKCAFVFTIVMCNISRGAAHIERYDSIVSCPSGGFDGTHNPSSRTRKNRVLTAE